MKSAFIPLRTFVEYQGKIYITRTIVNRHYKRVGISRAEGPIIFVPIKDIEPVYPDFLEKRIKEAGLRLPFRVLMEYPENRGISFELCEC